MWGDLLECRVQNAECKTLGRYADEIIIYSILFLIYYLNDVKNRRGTRDKNDNGRGRRPRRPIEIFYITFTSGA